MDSVTLCAGLATGLALDFAARAVATWRRHELAKSDDPPAPRFYWPEEPEPYQPTEQDWAEYSDWCAELDAQALENHEDDQLAYWISQREAEESGRGWYLDRWHQAEYRHLSGPSNWGGWQ